MPVVTPREGVRSRPRTTVAGSEAGIVETSMRR
jgi:hypothetical protein